jgi:hypothetical protein
MRQNRRYPIDMDRYCQKTGALLVHRIGRVIEKLGYLTWISIGQSNGVDLEVYQNGSLVFVAEILNWSIYTRLSKKRKSAIVNNLSNSSFSSCTKALIYTSMRNPKQLNSFSSSRILIIKLGCQILPKFFYNFYALKNQVVSRRVDSKATTAHIRSTLQPYL